MFDVDGVFGAVFYADET